MDKDPQENDYMRSLASVLQTKTTLLFDIMMNIL